MSRPTQPTFLALATLLTLGFAGSSIGADDVKSVRYVCPDGERFSVEYKRNYARLRNGSGVFALSADDAAQGRYSDGNLTLSPHDGGAVLQRAGQSADECLSEARRS